MQISIIAAITDDRLIGVGNQLIWHLPADLKHFKTVTMGKPIIMGRKTHEAIGKPLPGRRNIVISRQKDFNSEGCEVFASLEAALIALQDYSEVMIIGGSEIYAAALPKADTMLLTLVHHAFTGDTYFPKWNARNWQEIEREDFEPDENNKYPYSFIVLKRK